MATPDPGKEPSCEKATEPVEESGEEVDEVKSNIEEDKAVDESVGIDCKVTVGNFMKKSSSESCESFLRQLEGVVMVKPQVGRSQVWTEGIVEKAGLFMHLLLKKFQVPTLSQKTHSQVAYQEVFSVSCMPKENITKG